MTRKERFEMIKSIEIQLLGIKNKSKVIQRVLNLTSCKETKEQDTEWLVHLQTEVLRLTELKRLLENEVKNECE
jgi:hypothetical protein